MQVCSDCSITSIMSRNYNLKGKLYIILSVNVGKTCVLLLPNAYMEKYVFLWAFMQLTVSGKHQIILTYIRSVFCCFCNMQFKIIIIIKLSVSGQICQLYLILLYLFYSSMQMCHTRCKYIVTASSGRELSTFTEYKSEETCIFFLCYYYTYTPLQSSGKYCTLTL